MTTNISPLAPRLPVAQDAIRNRCFHPSRAWTPLRPDETVPSIIHCFEQHALHQPAALAVKAGVQQLTYAELNQRANQVAHAILACCGPDSQAVVLLFAHEVTTIIAILGLWKAGKFSVVLDTKEPLSRLHYVCQDAQAACILTDQPTLALAQQLQDSSTHLIEVSAAFASQVSHNPGLPIHAMLPARLTYTSGSTGQPKGILRTQGHLLHDVAACNEFFHMGPHDRFLYFMPGFELCASVATGAAIIPFDLHNGSMRALADSLHHEEITNIRIKPTVFRRLVDALTDGEQFPAMRLLHLVGEEVYPRDVELYKKHFGPDCVMSVTFGSQETLNCQYYLIDQQTRLTTDRVPVGYSVADMQVQIVDDEGQPVAFEQPGEIAIQSRYLATGYWRRPELTAQKFLPDPAGGDQRIYLSGDLGYRLADGCLFYIGRKDLRLKIRGYTIEPAEIELALLNLGTIKEAVVTAFTDPNVLEMGESARLIAYIVPATQPPPPMTTLRQSLQQTLPAYMIPAWFEYLDALPQLPNGKLDRRRLPAPSGVRPQLATPYCAPQNMLEQLLVSLWQTLLNVSPIGIDDNFLELGGDSLRAMMLVNRLQPRLDQPLQMGAFFDASTVAQQAAYLVQHHGYTAVSVDMAQLINDLAALSDKEAQHLLHQKEV